MKRFNIVKQDIILFDKFHLPINACFGRFTTTYKKKYKTVSEDIIYYVDNFKPIKFADCQAIRINVYDVRKDMWINTHTQAHSKYQQLHIFLLQMFVKNNIQQNRVCKYWLDYKAGEPREKKAQVHSDSVFRVNVGYALSKNVMTCHNINRDGWLYDNDKSL